MTPPTTSSLAMEVDYLWGQVLNISEPPTPVAARKKNFDKPKTEDTGRNIWKPRLCQCLSLKRRVWMGVPCVNGKCCPEKPWVLLNESPSLGISNLPMSCGPGKSQRLPKQDRLLPLPPPHCSPELDGNTILQLVSLDSILFPWKDVLHWG